MAFLTEKPCPECGLHLEVRDDTVTIRVEQFGGWNLNDRRKWAEYSCVEYKCVQGHRLLLLGSHRITEG